MSIIPPILEKALYKTSSGLNIIFKVLFRGGLKIEEVIRLILMHDDHFLKCADIIVIHIGHNNIMNKNGTYAIKNVNELYTKYNILIQNVKTICPSAILVFSGLLPRVGHRLAKYNDMCRYLNRNFTKIFNNLSINHFRQFCSGKNNVIHQMYIMRGRFPGVHLNEVGKHQLANNIVMFLCKNILWKRQC